MQKLLSPPRKELQDCLNSSMTMDEVAAHFGACQRVIYRWMDEYGLPRRLELRKRASVSAKQPEQPQQDLPGEIWRPVVGWKNLYSVSNLGRVRSMARRGHKSRVLKPYVNRKDFPRLMVCLSDGRRENGGREQYPHVHKLVLEAFVGPRPTGMVCRHLNGNPSDNRLENLKWGTRQENAADARRHSNRRASTYYRPVVVHD